MPRPPKHAVPPRRTTLSLRDGAYRKLQRVSAIKKLNHSETVEHLVDHFEATSVTIPVDNEDLDVLAAFAAHNNTSVPTLMQAAAKKLVQDLARQGTVDPKEVAS